MARFVGALGRRILEQEGPEDLGGVVRRLDETLRGHDYFQIVALQAAAIGPAEGVVTLVNAGLPSPTLYTARRGRCDVLVMPGELLHAAANTAAAVRWEVRQAEMGPGDVLVLATDGLAGGTPVAVSRDEARERLGPLPESSPLSAAVTSPEGPPAPVT